MTTGTIVCDGFCDAVTPTVPAEIDTDGDTVLDCFDVCDINARSTGT